MIRIVVYQQCINGDEVPKKLKTTFLIQPENGMIDKMEDVLACMFWRNPELAGPALRFLELISKRGGLNDSYWSTFCEDNNITRGQYDSIISKLKAGGFIYKRNNTWVIYEGFEDFLAQIVEITKKWREEYEK